MEVLAGRLPWLRWSILAGLALVALLFVANVAASPALLRDAQFPIYLLVLVVLVAFYLALTLWWTARPILTAALWWGILCGLVTGLGWLLEIGAGNLAVGQTWQLIPYFGGTLIALALTLLAGATGVLATHTVRGGLIAGTWCGMVSGLIGCLALLALPRLFLVTLQQDAQTIAEFGRSGAPDLVTYIVGDYSAAAIAHLGLGLLLGLVLGALGAVIGAGVVRGTSHQSALSPEERI